MQIYRYYIGIDARYRQIDEYTYIYIHIYIYSICMYSMYMCIYKCILKSDIGGGVNPYHFPR